MSDDWEEDFEVPDFAAKVAESTTSKKIDYEEDEESHENDNLKQSAGASKQQTEAAAKKARDEEIKLANKLKQAHLDNLTPEQRKLREREMVEEADVRLAGELFGGSSQSTTEEDIARGLGSIPIKTKQDHVNFAILCTSKMEDSTPFNILAYYKEVTEGLKSNLTLEGLDEIIKSLTLIRDEKKKTSAPATVKAPKKSAKQIKEEQRKHDDVFGGVDDDYHNESQYDEDDFM